MMKHNGIGEKEFFDLVKRANRDLNSHERDVIWTIIQKILQSPATFLTKKIKFVDREAPSMNKIDNLLNKATEIQKKREDTNVKR